MLKTAKITHVYHLYTGTKLRAIKNTLLVVSCDGPKLHAVMHFGLPYK